MDGYEFAWAMYIVGSLGCGIAAWLLFRRFGHVWSHFFSVTVLALLLTPYAMDAKAMTMAPALFMIVFGALQEGFASVMPIIMVLLGVWVVGLIISLIIQLIGRRFGHKAAPNHHEVGYHSHAEHDDYDEEHEEVEDHAPRADSAIRAMR